MLLPLSSFTIDCPLTILLSLAFIAISLLSLIIPQRLFLMVFSCVQALGFKSSLKVHFSLLAMPPLPLHSFHLASLTFHPLSSILCNVNSSLSIQCINVFVTFNLELQTFYVHLISVWLRRSIVGASIIAP